LGNRAVELAVSKQQSAISNQRSAKRGAHRKGRESTPGKKDFTAENAEFAEKKRELTAMDAKSAKEAEVSPQKA
jgi:hypothetical protein